ncbi:MAG TPA: ParB/RepB/Spo0J family partition protein [Geobacteraceae bacterium]|nr:ParB/RepB/Spo0J family partition protein [Geobacteraceae bacterium]
MSDNQLTLFKGSDKEPAKQKEAGTRFKKGKLYMLGINDLRTDPEQPRKHFDEEALLELKTSIEAHGVLQPVLFRVNDNGDILLISGERRYQAAKLAGLAAIPAIFTMGDPTELSLVENLLRENLTAIEESEAVQNLKMKHDYQLEQLSKILGKSVSSISEIISLTNLPDSVKDDCRKDPKVARSTLVEIAKMSSPEKMTELYRRYRENNLTRDDLRRKSRRGKPAGKTGGFRFIRTSVRRMSSIDASSLLPPEKDSLIRELEKLQENTLKLLTILRS